MMTDVSGVDLDSPVVRPFTSHRVWVTHIDTPEQFFCRLVLDDTRFSQLQDKIDRHIQKAFGCQSVDCDTVAEDDLVLAFSQACRKWSRARVVEVRRDLECPSDGEWRRFGSNVIVQVDLVDHGGQEEVPLSSCSLMPEEILEFNGGSAFAKKCSLMYIKPKNDGWDALVKDTFAGIVNHKQMTMNLYQHANSVFFCDLADATDGHTINSLAEFLVYSGLAAFKLSEHETYRVSTEEFYYGTVLQV